MRIGFWVKLWLTMGFAPLLNAQETVAVKEDSILSFICTQALILYPETTYVIPAGPVAGSFTPESRIQVVDTVAGWAKILVEGWVPVEHVLSRMVEEAPKYQFTEKEKPRKTKADRPQCIEMTAKGKQCSRKAIAGGKRCWQHSQ